MLKGLKTAVLLLTAFRQKVVLAYNINWGGQLCTSSYSKSVYS